MTNKKKILGQIYTPFCIVNDMLDIVGYTGDSILQKHIIDNSCGDGAFLRVIVERYIEAYKNKHHNLDGVESDLQTYIHGIEIDLRAYSECLNNLKQTIFLHGLQDIKWDVLNADALDVHEYDKSMDFVVGNPPYIRIHNLMDKYEKIRNFEFAKFGMTDMYIVFYELGFNMLKPTGKLCYITPNSFYSSNAGHDFRHYIIDTKHLYSLIDLGHYQPFSATTYTTICAFDFSSTFDDFDFSRYSNDGKIVFEEKLNLKEAFNNGKMILAKKQEQQFLVDIQNFVASNPNAVVVKNGFATLCDKVFINKSFPFESDIIDVVKASTGEWKKAIFPYEDGSVLKFDDLDVDVQKYLLDNKETLKKRSYDKGSQWYAYGRSQAIGDVNKNKFAINTTIKDKNSIKITNVKAGQGVYSGLYILTNLSESSLRKILINDDFIEYIKILGKCKSGGYYTYSSGDLKQYILYKMEKDNE